MKYGLENLTAFDKILQLNEDIAIGEKVICRGGFGTLQEMNDESLTVSLEPWDVDKVYKPPPKSRIAR